jgi:hypothetical protein
MKPASNPDMKTVSGQRRDLRRIMIWGSALGAGLGAGSLAALRPHLNFVLGANVVVGFCLGFLAVYGYWTLMFKAVGNPQGRMHRRLASGLMAFLGIAALLYPIRYIAPVNYQEVTVGLATAFCALSGVGALLFLTSRCFEERQGISPDRGPS